MRLINMEAKAVVKYIRMSPQKVRLVVDLVRGKKVQEASNILFYTRKYAAGIIASVLKSAIANADIFMFVVANLANCSHTFNKHFTHFT